MVDFYFTDGTAALNGEYEPNPVVGTTDVEMVAFGDSDDLIVWLDFAQAALCLNNDDEAAAIDDSVSKLISRVPGGSLQLSPNGLDK